MSEAVEAPAAGPQPAHARAWPAGRAPLVSVLVVAYNHERFIRPCLNAILAQVADFPIEIIVHDDASTDATAAIIAAYARRFPDIVRPVLQRENQLSLGKKILPGLHGMARGRYIAYCDGDDAWLNPAKLATQVAFLEASPEYVLSFHDAVHVDAEGRLIKHANLPAAARRDYTREELRTLQWGWMLLGTIVHRNLRMEFPPEYSLVCNGDNFIPMLLAIGGGARFQGEAGPLAYRKHGASMWSSQTVAEKVRMHLQSYLQIAAYFVRIGEADAARGIIDGKLGHTIVQFEQVMAAARDAGA